MIKRFLVYGAIILSPFLVSAYSLDSVGDSLPDQTGNNGKYLTTDGTDPSWATLAGGGDMAAATYDPAGVSEQLVGLTAVQTVTNKTLTTPTINSFVNANHDHSNAAGGGTITAASVSDFDTEVSNNTDVTANSTHRTSNGSDHTFIDQSVVSGSAPTFTADNFSDGGGNAIITTTQETNFGTAYTHANGSTGADHTYIDQSVVSGASPTFTGTNITSFSEVSASGQIYGSVSNNITTTATITIDLTHESHSIDLQSAGAALNLTLSNIVTGNSYLIEFVQGATARQISTITPAITWKDGATPNITTTENATTIIGIWKSPAGTVLGNGGDYY